MSQNISIKKQFKDFPSLYLWRPLWCWICYLNLRVEFAISANYWVNLLVMKKITNNASKYANNKMAKMAYSGTVWMWAVYIQSE